MKLKETKFEPEKMKPQYEPSAVRKGDNPWVQVRPFKADLGAPTATGFLFIADPVENSLIRGKLSVLGLEDVSFEARVAGPPIKVSLNIDVVSITVMMGFDGVARAFQGLVEGEDPNRGAAEWKKIADIPNCWAGTI